MDSPQIEAGSAPAGKRRLKNLSDLDRRTSAAKAAFALRAAITQDLGGEDRLSAMERAIVKNVALLGAALDDIAARYLSGEFDSLEMAQFATLANAQRRLLADLGLERRAVEVPQNLSSYLAGRVPPKPQDVETVADEEVSP